MLGKKSLFVHHAANGVMLLSPVDPRALQNIESGVFDFQLPPPLNAYVYPTPLLVCGDEAGSAVSLTLTDFSELCSRLDASALKTEMVEAIYDVPAIPLMHADHEEQLEDESDGDVEGESGDDMCNSSDDEDWEIEDDEASLPTA